MIEIMSESTENLLIIEVKDKLTAKDYENTFIPALDKIIQQQGKARVIICFNENFSGFELGAAWDDAKFGLRHRHDFEKIAVVGGPRWIEWSSKVGAHFMKGQMKVYGAGCYQEALDWAKD